MGITGSISTPSSGTATFPRRWSATCGTGVRWMTSPGTGSAWRRSGAIAVWRSTLRKKSRRWGGIPGTALGLWAGCCRSQRCGSARRERSGHRPEPCGCRSPASSILAAGACSRISSIWNTQNSAFILDNDFLFLKPNEYLRTGVKMEGKRLDYIQRTW